MHLQLTGCTHQLLTQDRQDWLACTRLVVWCKIAAASHQYSDYSLWVSYFTLWWLWEPSDWLLNWPTAGPRQHILGSESHRTCDHILLSDGSGNLKTLQSLSESSEAKLRYGGHLVSESWCQAPCGAQDRIFVTVKELPLCWWGAHSVMRGWVCRIPWS
jgi:hypothetical protein